MRIAVAGGTGFIGSALARALLERGDEVLIISRSGGPVRMRTGNSVDIRSGRSGETETGSLDRKRDGRSRTFPAIVTWEELQTAPARLEGVDAIVNLAGETINQRWTGDAKRRIVESRTSAAARIADAVQSLERKPAAVIQASAVGGYGVSAEAVFTEQSLLAGNDFLSNVVRDWEQSADRIEAGRIVKLRIGLVLDRQGGAFPLMRLPYRFFAGGRMGSGSQWVSWIHLDDLVRLILFCLDRADLSGPVNGTAPFPVTNDAFGRAIARVEGKPHWLPIPAFALKAALGEMSTLLLDGQRVIPEQALAHGFTFRYPEIDDAVKALLGK
ncbi:TIGR01777 family oxidoreductase [Paenibacillus thailandensis]|uniref:TIGR01777 family oxidoreductase n=1 Tax=Paenibacillus thailandensis TaxID=393250 RepID=A0ABW5QXU2_9BACL